MGVGDSGAANPARGVQQALSDGELLGRRHGSETLDLNGVERFVSHSASPSTHANDLNAGKFWVKALIGEKRREAGVAETGS